MLRLQNSELVNNVFQMEVSVILAIQKTLRPVIRFFSFLFYLTTFRPTNNFGYNKIKIYTIKSKLRIPIDKKSVKIQKLHVSCNCTMNKIQ